MLWAQADATTTYVKVAPISGGTPVTVASWTTVNTGAATPTTAPSWLNDDAVIYDKEVSTNSWEIHSVNRDGTGDFTEHSGITSYSSSLYPAASFGEYRSWVVVPDATTAPAEVYTSDGITPVLVHTCQWRNSLDGRALPSWQNASDTLGFPDMPNGSGTCNWYTVAPDGTGKTNIYADSSRVYWNSGRHSWLSDDSAIVVLRALTGTIFTSTDARVAIISASGGGPSDISPSLDNGRGTNSFAVAPYVWDQGNGTPRIYVQQYNGGGSDIDGVSVLEDGSDYFVDAPYAYLSRFYEGFGIST